LLNEYVLDGVIDFEPNMPVVIVITIIVLMLNMIYTNELRIISDTFLVHCMIIALHIARHL